jgi:ribosome-associated translation inhibitor RaiA
MNPGRQRQHSHRTTIVADARPPILFPPDSTTEVMIHPVQITFRHMHPSPAVEARIRQEADKLNELFDGITSCRVTVDSPRHRNGDPIHVRIQLGVPAKDLAVTDPAASHTDSNGSEEGAQHGQLHVDDSHRDVYVAIRGGFKTMRRQLQDCVRRLPHEVKACEPPEAAGQPA